MIEYSDNAGEQSMLCSFRKEIRKIIITVIEQIYWKQGWW